MDLPRDELLAKAEEVLRTIPNSKVYFKFSCQNCGSRQTFSEPNKLFESGKCEECGHVTIIKEGGFLLEIG